MQVKTLHSSPAECTSSALSTRAQEGRFSLAAQVPLLAVCIAKVLDHSLSAFNFRKISEINMQPVALTLSDLKVYHSSARASTFAPSLHVSRDSKMRNSTAFWQVKTVSVILTRNNF